MTVHRDNILTAADRAIATDRVKTSWLEYPRVVWLYAITLIVLYAPEVWRASSAWFTNPNYSHGALVLPLSGFLIWLQRDNLRAATRQPEPLGLMLLFVAVLAQVSSYLLQIHYIGMWSLIPAIAGAILLLQGREYWRISRFAVCFLIFASQIPNSTLSTVGLWIQDVSTTGASLLVQTLGVPMSRAGNLIQLPGGAVEVAEVCSGYNKLIALIAFAALYGYMYPISRSRRLILVLSALPVAVCANVLRIAALIGIGTVFGMHTLHLAHNWAETGVLALAFGIYLLLGRKLGCDTFRFTL